MEGNGIIGFMFMFGYFGLPQGTWWLLWSETDGLWWLFFRTPRVLIYPDLWSPHPFARCQEVSLEHQLSHTWTNPRLSKVSTVWRWVGSILAVVFVFAVSSVDLWLFHLQSVWILLWQRVCISQLSSNSVLRFGIEEGDRALVSLPPRATFLSPTRTDNLHWFPLGSSLPHTKWKNCVKSSAEVLFVFVG